MRILYPADSTPAGQELRLRQEYFFASASIQDILRRHLQYFGDIKTLPQKAAIHLNDTHPAVAVTELMRLLIDQHKFSFADAWDMTRATFAYTNHTLLPEALESWPLPLVRTAAAAAHAAGLCDQCRSAAHRRRHGGMDDRAIASVSLIDENGERRVRMANLAFAGSHSVNGVAALHTELMKETVFADLHQLYPERINNKTNGITPTPLAAAMQSRPDRPDPRGDRRRISRRCRKARRPGPDGGRCQLPGAFRPGQARQQNRAGAISERTIGLHIDPDALFDVQVKRIHEYKRQLLNIIETVALYDQIRSHPERNWTPRVKLFAGKAAPSYHNAKMIIKLANDVARRVNSDPSVDGLLEGGVHSQL